MQRFHVRRACAAVLLVVVAVLTPPVGAQSPQGGAQSSLSPVPASVINKIREEGLERSQAMQTLSYLTDVIGPRLTGSPNLKRANEWTRDTLTKWGLEHAKL